MQKFGTLAMADRAVLLPSDPELVQLLRSMELDREALIEVVRFADRERTLCTSNDLRGFDLITVNDKAARGLREVFCGKSWIKDETDNQAGIRNPRLGLRVIACNLDGNAGNPVAAGIPGSARASFCFSVRRVTSRLGGKLAPIAVLLRLWTSLSSGSSDVES
jgi:hypothetical protein